MQFLKEVYDGLAIIGAGTVIYLLYFAWQHLKKATTSAKKSNLAFRSKVSVPDHDTEAVGVEVPWTTNRPN